MVDKKRKSLDGGSDAPKKKSKKDSHGPAATLTADGVNGVTEHESKAKVETTTEATKKGKSMQQEAQNTVDKEIEEEFASFSDNDESNAKQANSDDEEDNEDNGAALLKGFDSDNCDDASDEGNLDASALKLPDYKKTQKKLRQAKEKGGQDNPGTVYVGRIPHGFYEPQMRAFFSQFGDITRLRLARNRRTGNSKHFAFIEFASTEVAKIVAAAMDNYLMFGHILKCKYAPPEQLHEDVFKGANKKYRRIPHEKLEGQKLAAPKTVEQWQKKNEREKKKRANKAKKLKETMGYEAPQKALVDPASVSKQKALESPKGEEQDEAADKQLELEVADASNEATNGGVDGKKVGKKGKEEKYVPPVQRKSEEKAKAVLEKRKADALEKDGKSVSKLEDADGKKAKKAKKPKKVKGEA